MSSVADLADTPTPPVVFGTADDLWLLLVERSHFECPGSMLESRETTCVKCGMMFCDM